MNSTIPLNVSIGFRELNAWQPGPGVVWVQARDPKHARRLSQRTDGTLVAYAVAGGYLKTFAFQNKSMAWAKRLLKRYTGREVPIYEPLSGGSANPVESLPPGEGQDSGSPMDEAPQTSPLEAPSV